MKRSAVFLAGLLSLITGPGRLSISADTVGAEHGNPDRGSFLFASYCASCHGDSGQGDGPMAPRLMRDFQVKPTNFAMPGWQSSRSDSELVRTIRQGGKAVHRTAFMPAWASTLDQQQTQDLLAYIRELGKATASGYLPASTLGLQQKLELGRVLYGLQCIACHGSKGKGDGPVMQGKKLPDFSKADAFRYKTDEDLEGWAQSGVYHAGITLDPDTSRWWHGPLNAEEIPALILYLRSFALR